MESGVELRPSCEESFIFISKDWTLGQLGHGTLYLFLPPTFPHPLECYKKSRLRKLHLFQANGWGCLNLDTALS